jgi:5-hydroxyisourate hydrolase
MSAITTHVLDTSSGRPASGVRVELERSSGEQWETIGTCETDADGRARALMATGAPLSLGVYRLTFHVGAYFTQRALPTFYPSVIIAFEVNHADEHYHVPLLVSPYGYTTYRGS